MNQKSELGKRKYSALIIGAGGQGALADAPGSGNEDKIVSFAHVCKEHPGFYINGFIDNNIEKANAATKVWGGHIFSSIKNAFGVSKMETYGPINVAIVTVPDDTHYEVLKELAEYPLKLVIVEKPICNDLIQAREIVELYKAKGTPLMVNYTRRF
ncbi:MAG: Gfo/Idh/MocA family oxidoreductase, partial [Candidatus Omnitrophota bacterium]